MKFAVVGSLALVAGTAVFADHVDDSFEETDNLTGDEDPFSSRSLANSPVPFPVLAVLTMVQFFNALQENWSETGREGDELTPSKGKWGSGVWKAIKTVPTVIYETGSMVAPLTLRYMLANESNHPHCQQRMLCEMNVRIKDRFGKPGEIAMQLASSMAGHAMGGTDAQRYDSLVDAARNGRRGKECHELYPKCNARSEGSPVPGLLRLASRFINN